MPHYLSPILRVVNVTPTGAIQTPNPKGIPFGIAWERVTRWTGEAQNACDEFNTPLSRVLATIVIESGGDPKAVQRNDENGWSYGLMQVVPRWWNATIRVLSGTTLTRDADLGLLMLNNPLLAIRCGVAVLNTYVVKHDSWDRASSMFFLGNPDWRGQDTANGNTGEGYRRSLNGLMEEIGGAVAELPYRVAHIPRTNPNRPRTPMNAGGPRFITVHETGNTRTGANAEMHRRFVSEQQGGPENVSFHLVVDDREAIELLPFTEIGFHAGDGCDNRGTDFGCFDSIAIETCVNADGHWERTLDNLAALCAKLIREQSSLDPDPLRQHHTWSGKDCPQRIRASGRWNELRTRVAQAGAAPPPSPVPVPGLPAWLTEAHVRAAFPDFNPAGIVSQAFIRYIATSGTLPIYERKIGIDTDSSLYIFDRVVILQEGTTANYEGEERG